MPRGDCIAQDVSCRFVVVGIVVLLCIVVFVIFASYPILYPHVKLQQHGKSKHFGLFGDANGI